MRLQSGPNMDDWAVYLNGRRIDYWQQADDKEGWVEGWFEQPGYMGLVYRRKEGAVKFLYEGRLGVVRGM